MSSHYLHQGLMIIPRMIDYGITPKSIDALLELIKEEYDKVDKFHGIHHITTVANDAIELATRLSLHNNKYILSEIWIGAILHDIGLPYGRGDHHNVGASWVERRSQDILNIFPDVDIQVVADIVREHRASYQGEYSSISSAVVSAADRRKLLPHDYYAYQASYQNTIGSGYDHAEAIPIAHLHVKDKYGTGGYAYKNNELYNCMYHERITKFREWVDQVTLHDVVTNISVK